jgi:hypothetical protein
MDGVITRSSVSREREPYRALSPSKRGTIAMRIEKYGKTRYWAVIDIDGTLVGLCVYRKGAQEVLRRLQAREKEKV